MASGLLRKLTFKAAFEQAFSSAYLFDARWAPTNNIYYGAPAPLTRPQIRLNALQPAVLQNLNVQ